MTAERLSTVDSPGGTPLQGRTVALVHEWFSVTGGSEQVFLAIADLVPHAERFVLWKERDVVGETDLRLHESWMSRTPLRRNKALALPMMPLAWRTLTRRRFDVVISSSHAFAHTVKAGPAEHTRYLSYVHSPARYLWSPAVDGRGSSSALGVARRALRIGDVRLGRHVHSLAANSREVRARIRRYWGRDARVIHPPVDTSYYQAASAAEQRQDRSYLLGVGRWIAYKNFDLMIGIAERAGLPLFVAGSGPEEPNLRRLAGRCAVPVTFEVRPTRERLRQLYWGARALLYPAHEDFGIVPVEAQACGTPVVGLARGGLLETVVDGATGVLVAEQSVPAYVAALRRVAGFEAPVAIAHSQAYSTDRFRDRVTTWLADEVP
jgi:glycosyltransferase involved in cell wall biosynthesis